MEAASRLHLAEKTVGNHVEHIYTKIGSSTRAEASLFAMQHGLLELDTLAEISGVRLMRPDLPEPYGVGCTPTKGVDVDSAYKVVKAMCEAYAGAVNASDSAAYGALFTVDPFGSRPTPNSRTVPRRSARVSRAATRGSPDRAIYSHRCHSALRRMDLCAGRRRW